jgi:rsbT co-antagonist protein RsbR
MVDGYAGARDARSQCFDQEIMERAIKRFTDLVPRYVERSVDRIIATKSGFYSSLPREVLRAAIARSYATVEQDVVAGTTQAYPDYLRQLGVTRAKQGASIKEMIHGLDHGFVVVTDDFEETFADDIDARFWWSERRREISYAGVVAVTDAYYAARESLIMEQNREILKLSAPMIPVYTGVLVLPLVGAVTAERAGLILQSLLASIAREQSQAVIIDVTGVHDVDQSVAEHLLQAARAAGLLGAKVILVGIRPAVADTIVRAGIDFRDIVVLANLKSGLEHALRLQGRAILVSARSRHSH